MHFIYPNTPGLDTSLLNIKATAKNIFESQDTTFQKNPTHSNSIKTDLSNYKKSTHSRTENVQCL